MFWIYFLKYFNICVCDACPVSAVWPTILPGFPQALEIMENLKSHQKKVPCMEKSWNLKKKKQNNHGKIMEFVK